MREKEKKLKEKKLVKEKNKQPVTNVIVKMVEEVLKAYKYGYQIDRILLSKDMYEQFKQLMYSKNTSIGILQFIDNHEYWNGYKITVNEDEWEFDSIIVQSSARIPEGYKSNSELLI